MARRQDELVESIRLRRRLLAQELRSILSLPALEASLRSRPLPWLLGGILAGWAGMRFLARPLWRDRRNVTRRWVRGRLRDTVLALFVAALREQQRTEAAAPEQGEEPDRGDARGQAEGRRGVVGAGAGGGLGAAGRH